MKFRDTKRSYNIINHSKGFGVSLSASEPLRDRCSLGHDLTLLRCSVSKSLPTVCALIHSFIRSTTVCSLPTVCQSGLAYQDRKIGRTGSLPLGSSDKEGRAEASSQLEQYGIDAEKRGTDREGVEEPQGETTEFCPVILEEASRVRWHLTQGEAGSRGQRSRVKAFW